MMVQMDALGNLVICQHPIPSDLCKLSCDKLTMYFKNEYPSTEDDLLKVPLPSPFSKRIFSAPVYWSCKGPE
jgi:hypothetical protein